MDKSQYNRRVGSRIKEMRKSRKMTLKELGEHIGLSESNTKRYEDGQIKTVGIDIIKKIALALDVPASYLTGWEDIPKEDKFMKSATFAERLSEAMQIREITQTELHRRTGINKSSINTYLKGGYKAKQDKVDILAEALNVSPVWLMGFDVPMNRKNYLNPEKLRKEMEEERNAIHLDEIIQNAKNIKFRGGNYNLNKQEKEMLLNLMQVVINKGGKGK